jgi:hypothetical protein
MKVVTVLFWLTWLAFTLACSERAPSAATTSAPTPAQIGHARDQASTVPTDQAGSSEQVRVFQLEDIVPAEQNAEPTIASENSVPAYRAPEESDEVTPVDLGSTDRY